MSDQQVPCLVYSRVVGYLTPISNWNEGKKQEASERVYFNADKSEASGIVRSKQREARGQTPADTGLYLDMGRANGAES